MRIHWFFGLIVATWAFGAEDSRGRANPEPFPSVSSKKGLQVQMVDDALALGIQHAALNFNLSQLVDPRGDTNNLSWSFDGKTYRFQRAYVESLDQQIKKLSDHGVVVSLILLNYVSGDPEVRRLLQHPDYSTNCPNNLSAFNVSTPESRAWLEASIEFLANRWSRSDARYGRVWNWIVGNEVNSHWFWANCGRVGMEKFADDYLKVVRLVHRAVRRQSANGRVYVSLEHHWNIRYPGGDAEQAFPGRAFLDYFARRAREGGDFDWNVAFHPYPENLFEPRSWKDVSATGDWRATPRITFKNLPQLLAYLDQSELKFEGRRRRVILSEQGFHTPDGPDGEVVQAAAYCYAWNQVAALDGIDSFILHRHVDHREEGGLRLGLWTRKPDSVATPERKKRIYEVFRMADTPRWKEAFEFALPVIGIRGWK
ncbi:MAG TPA: DUF5722 domain-containing protein [Verrucomicrobiota bacterium]|nr:hypothetical protein [Verrucomicrobiales bacterium]HRI13697.1 DUF5722 domain-containing protein [Verrucomicrobiota bacterium]